MTDHAEGAHNKSITGADKDLLEVWISKWIENATKHKRAAKKKRVKHRVLSFVVSVVPMLCTLFVNNDHIEERNIIIILALSVVAAANCINQTMQYDSTSKMHEQTSIRLEELYHDTQEALSKSTMNRTSIDIFIRTVKQKYDFINRCAPDLSDSSEGQEDDETV